MMGRFLLLNVLIKKNIEVKAIRIPALIYIYIAVKASPPNNDISSSFSPKT